MKEQGEKKQGIADLLHEPGFLTGCIGLAFCFAVRDIPQFLTFTVLTSNIVFRYCFAAGRLVATLAIAILIAKTCHQNELSAQKKTIVVLVAVAAVFEMVGLFFRFFLADSPAIYPLSVVIGIGQGTLILAWCIYLMQRPRVVLFYTLIGAMVAGGCITLLLAVVQTTAVEIITIVFPVLSLVCFMVVAHIDTEEIDKAHRPEKIYASESLYSGEPFSKRSVISLVAILGYSFIARILTDMWMQQTSVDSLSIFEGFGSVGTIVAGILTYMLFTMTRPLKNRPTHTFFVVPIVAVALYLSSYLTGPLSVVFVPLVFILRKMLLTMAVFGAIRLETLQSRLLYLCAGMAANELGNIVKTTFSLGAYGHGELTTTIVALVCLAILVFIAIAEISDFLQSTNNVDAMLKKAAEDAHAPSENDRAVEKQAEVLSQMSEDFKLSKRERDVLELLVAGRNAEYIANTLFVAHSTAKTHISHIYTKTGLSSQQRLMDEYENRLKDALARSSSSEM